MNSKAKSPQDKRGRFSNEEVKALFVALGVGVVLGVAVEMVDAALPKEHKMSAVVQRLMERRKEPKRAPKSSFDMERPGVGFSVTE